MPFYHTQTLELSASRLTFDDAVKSLSLGYFISDRSVSYLLCVVMNLLCLLSGLYICSIKGWTGQHGLHTRDHRSQYPVRISQAYLPSYQTQHQLLMDQCHQAQSSRKHQVNQRQGLKMTWPSSRTSSHQASQPRGQCQWLCHGGPQLSWEVSLRTRPVL